MHPVIAFKSMQDIPATPTVANDNTNCQATSQERVSSSSTASDNEASPDSESPGSIYDAIIAAIRGQPDLLAEVQAILSIGPELSRTCTTGTKRTSERTSQDNSQTPAKSLKRRRAADSQGGIPKDEESSKVKTRTAGEKNETRLQPKFACAYNKLYPAIYCKQTSIGGTGNFYQSCSGSGWGKAQHLL
jgi:hypothetical protein